ncbi:hypothetical protein CCP3SC15_3920002 [Gammaproteobacteria bacterium]
MGGGGNDYPDNLAVTADSVYVGGTTYSSDFPGTAGGAQAANASGNAEAFVARLSPDLKTLIQATYLAGSGGGTEWANALTITDGSVYVAGITSSTDFPGTVGGFQATNAGGWDAFVARLSLNLKTLTQATYLGGSGNEGGNALAMTADSIYVSGGTLSTDFPGTAGGVQATNAGGSDVFVARLSLDLKTLTQATYLGGSDDEGTPNTHSSALAVTTDSVYIAGSTLSSDFPGTAGGVQAANAGGADAFVARLSLDLKTLTQAT